MTVVKSFLLLVALATGCAATTDQDSSLPTEQEVSAFLASYERAIAMRDWPSVRRAFIPTATIVVSEDGEITQYSATQYFDELTLAVSLAGYTRERRDSVIEQNPTDRNVRVRSRLVETVLEVGGMKVLSQKELMFVIRHDGRVQITVLGFERP